MPDNEVGDRVHNFFGQENLSQGQHSHAAGKSWASDNNLWVGGKKGIGSLSSNTRTYNPEQSDIEPRHNSQRIPVPNAFNFMNTTASHEFARNHSQSQHQNLNGYMHGRHILHPRQDEANFMGLDAGSVQDNVNQRGLLVHELQQGGVSEQTSNSHRSNEVHGSSNPFGGQDQMNNQHPGPQLMIRKLEELPRKKEIQRQIQQQKEIQRQIQQQKEMQRQILQGGFSEPTSNSHRSNEFDAHGSSNPFGGQDQMNNQHPGPQLMIRKLEELRKQKEIQRQIQQQKEMLRQILQGGFSEPTSNSHRSNEFDAHGSSNPFRGQDQMNNQHPGPQLMIRKLEELRKQKEIQRQIQQQKEMLRQILQGGFSEPTSNSHRSNEFDAHGSSNPFGGQDQMNSQQLMFRKLEELRRQKEIERQHSSANQARQASDSHSHGFISGTPTSESSWAELATGNNWLQRASPVMHGSSSGLVFSPEQGQAQRSVGFDHQQFDQSSYGAPLSSSRGLLNPYPYAATDKASAQQMPSSLPGSQYAGIPKQVIIHDGTPVSRRGLSGKGLFGHMSGQGSNSWMNMEQSPQLKAAQQTGLEQEFQGPQDLIGPSEMAQDEPAIESSLDPDEEKFLFSSDANIWDAFGSDKNMGGRATNFLDDDVFASGRPSIQSGSWSALMQSAAAENSSSGTDPQEELFGLNAQNHELSSGRRPSACEYSGEQQTPLADINLPNASAMSFGVFGAEMKDKHQRNMGFQHHDNRSPHENDVRPHPSSQRVNQYSSGGNKWLNGGPLQKMDARGSRLYRSNLPTDKRNDWTPVESISNPGERALNTNENDDLLPQSESSNHTRVMHEGISQGDGVWSVNAHPNSIVHPKPTSMDSLQINGDGVTVNSAAAKPNLSNIQGASHFGQFHLNSQQLNNWKHVESSVRSNGSGNSRKPQGHLNKSSQVSESSFNSSDKEDLKMHEIESRSRRENSNDSYQSSSSRQVATSRMRENSLLNAANFGDFTGTKQHLSNQPGRMTSGQHKFLYHPMGNLDEDVNMPYRKRQGKNTQAMSLQHFLGLRGQDQGSFGHTKINGQGHVPDLEGISEGSHDMRSKNMIGGHVSNMFAPFDRSVGLLAPEKASQPSQNMLELLDKVDQSRDCGTVRHLTSSEHNLSPEMPEPDCSDGSLGGLQRSQSSNSQGFGLQLGPPLQRLPVPDKTSTYLNQAEVSPNLKDRGQAPLPSLSPFQKASHGVFKNNSIGSSEQILSETAMHKMTANLSSSFGAVSPNSRSQLQNHQMVGARGGLVLTNNPDNESFNRVTDETCNGSRNAESSHERVEAPQTSGRQKLATLPQTNAGMSEHCRSSKMLPNESTNLSIQQQCQPSLLNNVEPTSLGLQNLEEQEAEKRVNSVPNLGPSSSNFLGVASSGEQSTKDNFSQNVLCGKVGQAQAMNETLRNLEAFGHSLKPNNLMNQVRSMKNMDNDPCNRATKRLKGSGNLLDGQQPDEHNDMVGDVSTCSTPVPPGDSQMLNLSESMDNAPPSVARELSSSLLPANAGIQDLVTVRPKKQRLTTANFYPWFMEISASSKNLPGICTGAVEWSRATNRLMEKVDDNGDLIEDVLAVARPKKRLIITTLLMQQLLRPPPVAILSIDASFNYESVICYVARLALGDACNLVSSARISLSGANCIFDKSNEAERDDDRDPSKVVEDLMSKAGKLEDDFLRVVKGASLLDMRVEFEDLERFSVINRFARYHGKGQADSLSEAGAPQPQRFVTALAFPANLPDSVQCVSL